MNTARSNHDRKLHIMQNLSNLESALRKRSVGSCILLGCQTLTWESNMNQTRLYKTSSVLGTSALLVALLGGCASTGSVTKAQATADEALSKANAAQASANQKADQANATAASAQSTAASAQSTANDAKATADAAKAEVDRLAQKIDNMFKKSMQK
jgi:multidrug resistance efflux pump